ncbi:MAG: hypothetical protein JXA82_19130 [Sedimentisphaerales bacterium]|nr:hypothetical protein [Sedimentisphaerales bacterium]
MIRRFFRRKYASSGAIQVSYKPHSVVKYTDPRFVHIESEVTKIARKVGEKSKLFSVPEVLGEDETTGSIELQRIDDMESIRERFSAGKGSLGLLFQAGRALAAIHERMKLPSSLVIPISLPWPCKSEDLVCLHGDFNINNVFFRPSIEQIVILDWASAGVAARGKTTGNRYFDICKFIRSLLCQSPSIWNGLVHFHRRTTAFLYGYEYEIGRTLDHSFLQSHLLRMMKERVRIQIKRRQYIKAIMSFTACLVCKILFLKWHEGTSFYGSHGLYPAGNHSHENQEKDYEKTNPSSRFAGVS